MVPLATNLVYSTSLLLLYAFAFLVSPSYEATIECGVSKILRTSDRIIGGRPALEREYPWQASLQIRRWYGFTHICGATILTERWLLTAAHCIKGNSASAYRVVAGTTRLHSPSSGSVYGVSLIVIKQGYSSDIYNNDISLVRLAVPMNFQDSSGKMNSICLPSPNQQFSGFATTTGWGVTEEDGQVSDVLNTVDVPIISRKECTRTYGAKYLAPSMFCAGFVSGGRDSCQGDSGGPLFQRINGKATLVGVVSWGVGCARVRRPGVYTEVSQYISWIEGNVK